MILPWRQCARWPRLVSHGHRSRCFASLISETRERRPSEKLPDRPARTRFAPSPTGDLHLGSLRTAIFNYLAAKATGGQFILRVEDTDQKRTVAGAVKRLCEDLRWAGLQWDEGPEVGGPHGPYIQSERAELYKDHAEKLIGTAHAYRCFCSEDRLQKLATHKGSGAKSTSGYDRKCANTVTEEESEQRARSGERHVVRLKMPDHNLPFRDLTFGTTTNEHVLEKQRRLRAQTGDFEDPIILKSDSLPTYHLANVVDDHLMKITHVIRAAEWLSSTPKHMALYEALGWEPPTFAHVGLILDSSKQKMSKRVGGHSIQSMRDQGILPEALVNHLALLGWSHRLTDDFVPLQELVDAFDLKFTKSNVEENPSKLFHLQQKYMARHIVSRDKVFDQMAEDCSQLMVNVGLNQDCTAIQNDVHASIRQLLYEQRESFLTPTDFVQRNIDIFYEREREKLKAKYRTPAILKSSPLIISRLETIPSSNWNVDALRKFLQDCQTVVREEASEAQPKAAGNLLLGYLRWALFGGRPGPALHEILLHLGRQNAIRRLLSAKKEVERDKASISERKSPSEALGRASFETSS